MWRKILFLAPEILLGRELYFFGKKYILKMTRVEGKITNGLGAGRTASMKQWEKYVVLQVDK